MDEEKSRDLRRRVNKILKRSVPGRIALGDQGMIRAMREMTRDEFNPMRDIDTRASDDLSKGSSMVPHVVDQEG